MHLKAEKCKRATKMPSHSVPSKQPRMLCAGREQVEVIIYNSVEGNQVSLP